MAPQWSVWHSVATGCLLLALTGGLWVLLGPVRKLLRRRRLLTLLAEARALFVDAVKKARVNGTLDGGAASLSRDVLGEGETEGEFGRLRAEARQSSFDFRSIHKRALALSRLRTYILPAPELLVEGLAALGELRDWGVPEAARADLEGILQDVRRSGEAGQSPRELARARSVLNQVLESYDHWDWYVRWYYVQMGVTTVALLAVTLLSLCAAVFCYNRGHVLLSFVLAGASGTAVSILLKLPPLSVYGEGSWFLVRTASRFAAGVAASTIGCGLLASGIISISMPSALGPVTPADIIRQCGDRGAVVRAAAASSRPESEPAPAGYLLAGSPQVDCSMGWMVFLLSVAMLFGFSERTLTSFEQVFLGTVSRGRRAGPGLGGTGPARRRRESPSLPPMDAEPTNPDLNTMQ